MATRKFRYQVVNDPAAAWSESFPCFKVNDGTKHELEAAVRRKLDHPAPATLYLRDDEGDFVDWSETELPAKGTISVKAVKDTGSLSQLQFLMQAVCINKRQNTVNCCMVQCKQSNNGCSNWRSLSQTFAASPGMYMFYVFPVNAQCAHPLPVAYNKTEPVVS